MAQLFIKQAKIYAESRPNYPKQLFDFISSNTPIKDLAWDVGTGSGQAALSLAGIYKNVIATDTSLKQLEFATKLPNIKYQQTPAVIPMDKISEYVSKESSVDLVTIAQALHWLDLPEFYKQVKWVLKKPHGVIAAWCYTVPEVNEAVDSVFVPFYKNDSGPYWDAARKWVDDKYEHIYFPFEEEKMERFDIDREMSLDDFLAYLTSWSAYQTAKEKGVELLSDQVVDKFKVAWNQDGVDRKIVKYPVYLRIGKVGDV
ncbi:S-adenosyl-L-methionine-dependent methyltransferases superfamily protein [Euphorbia peplus]|nr:S-adenosyl-L-methionine-dependent methyltransferases superfamily protein [Euphorbia peplus]